MYPLVEKFLTVRELVKHWSRCLQPLVPETEFELMELFCRAYWQRDSVFGHDGYDYRESGFNEVMHTRFPLGIHFVLPNFDRKSARLDFKGREVNVPRPTLIRVNDASGKLTPLETMEAYKVLSQCELKAFPWDFHAQLARTRIGREQFRDWCLDRGWPLPPFWFRQDAERKPATAGAEARCRRWLVSQAQGPKRWSKEEYRRLAMREFKVLSARAFDRAWELTVPAGWREAGRPTRAARRSKAISS